MISNFGQNVTFSPKYTYKPKSEQDVLDILNKHKNGKIRAMGSLHAWSMSVKSDDVFINTELLNKIEILEENGEKIVSVQGGCKLENLIEFLAKENLTIPAMGGIMKQSVAGLASTATHGTGNSSFSHFIKEMCIAGYNKDSEARLFIYNEGDALKSARTSLGCMGIIVSMKIPCKPKYWIHEKSRLFENIEDLLNEEKDWPLQQTVVIPYSWKLFAFQRKVGLEPKNKLKYSFMRFFDYLAVEIMPHIFLKGLLLLKNRRTAVVGYYNFLPKLLTGTESVNEDCVGLTLHTRHHYTFRHVETEIFIPERNMLPAYKTIIEIVEWFAGRKNHLSDELTENLKSEGLLEKVLVNKNKYVLHYASFIRKVFPDQSLIGMTAGEESYYAMGFFTYDAEKDRGEYYNFAYILSLVLNKLYDARLHWGKNFPLSHNEISRLYPEMEKFKEICKSTDPNSVFQNEFTKKVFGE